jgi:hypothetical protein
MKFMKQLRACIFLAFTLLIGNSVTGQNLKFADDPGQFMTQLRKLMDGSRNAQYAKAAAQLDSVWMSGISSQQQTRFIGVVKTQAGKGQKASPVMYLLIRNAYLFAKNPGTDFDGFLELVTKAGEKYDAKSLEKVLNTIRTISETNKLYAANYNSLYLLSGSYKFRFDTTSAQRVAAATAAANDTWDTPVDTGFVIAPRSTPIPVLAGAVIDLTDAVFGMVTTGDSVAFGPTTGSVSLRDGIFVGKGGKFTWESVGNPDISTDLDAYSFNITQPKLVAENVTLHHSEQLAAPIKGTLEYRGVKKIKGQLPAYPRFISNGIDARLRDTRKNISYKGGFALIGTVMSSACLSDEPSTLVVSYKDKPAFKVVGKHFALKDSVFSGPLAYFWMPLGTDSLYHPGVGFVYNDDEGLLKLARAEKTDFGPLPYQDTYHKMNIWSQAMRWKFPNDKVEFLRIDGKQVVPVRLESFDYFKKERFRDIAQEYGFQPMMMAASFTQTEKRQTFLADELAAKFKQNPKILRRSLERLALDGYFIYDKRSDEFAISKKGVLYILANLDKADYDNFQITSQFSANEELANATIYLPDTLMTVLGVSSFVVSDSLKIIGVPSDKKIVIGRNRNFTMNGQLVASNYQFRGQNLKFDYKQFFVNVSPNDSITFTPRDKFKKGQSGEVGGHVKYDKGGTFYLSDAQNKSGLQKGKKSPRLVVPDGMIVYFDQPERGTILYPREVFFKIPKIDMDGLDQRDVIFEGTFNSNGIIPPIQTILKSMQDNSLGFEHKPPLTDLKLYGGKALARFTDTLVMDNGGLRSKAVIKYLSASMTAKHVLLAADSLLASGDVASIKEATIGKGYFPAVEVKDYAMRWYPNADSMFLTTQGKSFSFYKGTTALEGGLLLRSTGLYGNGRLKRADSEVTSREIKFNKDGFLADKSSFVVNSIATPQKPAKNIIVGKNADIDFNFKTGIALFQADSTGFNTDSTSMEIPSVSYRTAIASAKWDMTKKTILMKGFGETSTYTATMPAQEGLTFDGTDALYDVEKLTVSVRGVPFIRSVDVKIVPDKGMVYIGSNGQMSPLKNARIEIDTLNVSHRMRDADIRIDSRNRFEGSATYQYITARKDTFNIKMQNFELKEVGLDPKKPRDNKNNTPVKYYTTARADVKEAENLLLSPRIQFKGGINLVAYEPSLKLDGFVKPVLKFRKNFNSSWIVYNESPGETVAIKVDKNLKNEHEIPLSVGLHYNEARGMYMSFLSPKESEGDEDIYLAKGALNYDEESKAFKVTPPPGKDNLIDESNTLKFNDKTGLASFSGPLKLIASDWLQSSGIVEAQVDSSRFSFNTMLMFKMPALEPVKQSLTAKIVETNLDEQNSTAADDDPDDLNRKLAALIGSKAVDAYMKLTAAGYKPLYDASPLLDIPMVLSNVNLRWSPTRSAYYSEGPIGVSHFGRNNVNAQMEGVLEIRRAIEGDEFSLYLQASPDVWYFFDYRQKELGIVSSQIDFNDQLTAKARSVRSKDMSLITLGIEEKDQFVNRFDDLYRPAVKKAKLVKTEKKKVAPAAVQKKKKEEQADGF